MTTPLLPSCCAVLILGLFGMGFFSGFGSVVSAEPLGIESDGELFFDPEEDTPDPQKNKQIAEEQEAFAKRSSKKKTSPPPPQSGKDERGYYQMVCDAGTNICQKVYSGAAAAAAAPFQAIGQQIAKGAADEVNKQLNGPLGQKTIPQIAENASAAAVKSAAAAAQTPEVQAVVSETSNTAAQGGVKGFKTAFSPKIGNKRKASESSQDGQSLPKKSRLKRAATAAKNVVTFVPKQIYRGVKSAGSAVKRKLSSPKVTGEPLAKKSKFSPITPVQEKKLPTQKVVPRIINPTQNNQSSPVVPQKQKLPFTRSMSVPTGGARK